MRRLPVFFIAKMFLLAVMVVGTLVVSAQEPSPSYCQQCVTLDDGDPGCALGTCNGYLVCEPLGVGCIVAGSGCKRSGACWDLQIQQIQ